MNWNEYFYLDRATGTLTWKHRPREHFKTDIDHVRWNARYARNIAGSAQFRAGTWMTVKLYRKTYKVHRIIWELVNGRSIPDGMVIDHANGNPGDNRPENLRLATIAENGRNSKSRGGNKWGLKGVRQQTKSGRFAAQIRAGGNPIGLGTYDTPEEAHEAYRVAAKKYHGDFANYGIDTRTP